MSDAPGDVLRQRVGDDAANVVGLEDGLDGGGVAGLGAGGDGRGIGFAMLVVVELAAGALGEVAAPAAATDGVGDLDEVLAGAESTVVGGGIGFG
ncbi:MAG: hypothetical protein V3T22_10710, partial [Planctomycetota bacterium]